MWIQREPKKGLQERGWIVEKAVKKRIKTGLALGKRMDYREGLEEKKKDKAIVQ